MMIKIWIVKLQKCQYFQKIINDKSLTAQTDDYGPGLRPFTPAISSSLSIPVENVADLISRKLISEYIAENNETSLIQSQKNAVEMAEVLKNMDLEFLIDPTPPKPQLLLDEEENIIASSGKELNKISHTTKLRYKDGSIVLSLMLENQYLRRLWIGIKK